MRHTKRAELVVPVLIVLYLIAYIAQTFDLPYDAVLYPYLVIGLLLALLGVFLFREFVSNPPGEGPAAEAAARRPEGGLVERGVAFCRTHHKSLGIIVCIALYPQIIKLFGFIVTTTLFLAALFWIFQTMRRLHAVPVALAISFVLKWLLIDLASLTLPTFSLARLPFNI
ncbi:MAG: hypothetical protein HY521_11275 [Proteobacteria bacterium]|nr:hypothetical protein [Pseudomonadota bacterium]